MSEQIEYRESTGISPTLAEIPAMTHWTADTIAKAHVLVDLPDAAITELDRVAQHVEGDDGDIRALDVSHIDLAATRAVMARVKTMLDHETGVVVLDRLPLDRYDVRAATACYWTLAGLIGRQVAQNWHGLMLYDVRDSGKNHGNGVRGSVTNVELYFHTDNSFGIAPPQYVGLLCLQTAKTGGESRLVNWGAVWDRLAAEKPELLARGAEPFLFDRQMEHAPDAPKVMQKPILRQTGDSIGFCFSSRLMRTGYRMADAQLDAAGAAFLDAVDDIVNRESMQFRMHLARGQIQFINNARIGHARSAFEDHDDPAKKRRLIRIWLREHGAVYYDG